MSVRTGRVSAVPLPTWSEEKTLECARGAGSCREFRLQFPSAHVHARRNGDIAKVHEACGLEKWLVWTVVRLVEVAARYTRRSAFENEMGGAYVAARKLGILQEIMAHMPNPYRR